MRRPPRCAVAEAQQGTEIPPDTREGANCRSRLNLECVSGTVWKRLVSALNRPNQLDEDERSYNGDRPQSAPAPDPDRSGRAICPAWQRRRIQGRRRRRVRPIKQRSRLAKPDDRRHSCKRAAISAGKNAPANSLAVRVSSNRPQKIAVAHADAMQGIVPDALKHSVVTQPRKAPANAAIGASPRSVLVTGRQLASLGSERPIPFPQGRAAQLQWRPATLLAALLAPG